MQFGRFQNGTKTKTVGKQDVSTTSGSELETVVFSADSATPVLHDRPWKNHRKHFQNTSALDTRRIHTVLGRYNSVYIQQRPRVIFDSFLCRKHLGTTVHAYLCCEKFFFYKILLQNFILSYKLTFSEIITIFCPTFRSVKMNSSKRSQLV